MGDGAHRRRGPRSLPLLRDVGFAGQILTAYAAARIPPAADSADAAGELIASMLTAGLDRDASGWRGVVEPGSMGWALLALATPDTGTAARGALEDFLGNDDSVEGRKSAFLVAGPALVALMAGIGMQSESWSQMTPLHLYHLTSALRQVGLEAEARMIAAEAVARG